MEVASHVPETASFRFEPLQNYGLSSGQSENLSKSAGRGGLGKLQRPSGN
jgi:hypothetical protein